MADDKRFIAYQIYEKTRMKLVAAPLERDWMDAANQRFPYRCLPLNIANQHGWFVTCPCDFEVYWYGGPQVNDLELRFDGPRDPAISTHFGYSVLTFSMAYLFRTPPGINLWVRGPSNSPKDGIQPLEGIVETDWASSTFTMNWKVTRPFEWIRFRKDEPICMLVPVPRGFLQTLEPLIEPMTANPELMAKYNAWSESRKDFLARLGKKEPEIVQRGWQKDYFQGRSGDGVFDGHQTRIDLKEFPPLDG